MADEDDGIQMQSLDDRENNNQTNVHPSVVHINSASSGSDHGSSHQLKEMENTTANTTSHKNYFACLYEKFTKRLHKVHFIVEEYCEKLFYQIGLFCATHPWKVIIFTILLVMFSSYGITMIETDELKNAVWVPDGSPSKQNNDYIIQNYGDFRLANLVIVAAKEGDDVLSKEVLTEAMNVHNSIMNSILKVDGVSYTYEDFCFKAFPFLNCTVTSVLDYWHFDWKQLQYDNDPHLTVSNPDATGSYYNTLDASNVVGGLSYVEGSEEMYGYPVIQKGEALLMSYLFKNAWEQDAVVLQWEKVFLEVTDTGNYDDSVIKIYRRSNRSHKDEVDIATAKDLPLFGLAFIAMIIYVCFALGKRNFLESKILLGLCGIGSVMLALVLAFGFCGYFQVTYSSAVIAVPFLILGIGTDDMFIIVNAFERTDPTLSLRERTARSLAISGSSVTITSLTDFVAFMASTNTRLPGMKGFVTFCAISVLCDFMLQVTFFVACMVLNERRAIAGRMDVVPCMKMSESKKQSLMAEREYARLEGQDEIGNAGKVSKKFDPDKIMSSFFGNYYGPFLMKKPVKIGVISISVIICVLSIVGATQIHSGLSDYDVLPFHSYVKEFSKIETKYFEGLNYPVDIVFKTFDYSDPHNQDEMLELYQKLQDSKWMAKIGDFWLIDFLDWLQTTPYVATLTSEGRPANEEDFYNYLYQFLSVPAYGTKYMPNIVFQYGFIKTCRIPSRTKALTTDLLRAECIVALRDICNSVDIPAIAYSFHYLFWEQYINLISSNVLNFVMVFVLMFIMVLVFLGDLKVTIIIVIALIMIDIDLLGIMYIWDIGLNNVSIVNLLLSIGLAVDACAHIAHATAIESSKTNNREVAVIAGLENIGASVFSGTLTSFLGIIVLGFAEHTILNIFFKFFFSIFLLAMLHGLALVPVLLSMIHPDLTYHAPDGKNL